MTPASMWSGALVLFLLGTPALMPIGLTVWTYGKAHERVRARLQVMAILGYPIAFGVLWAVTELNDNTSPWNVPMIAAALLLVAASTGVAIARFWPEGDWLACGAVGLLVLLDVGLTGFVTVIAMLFLSGVH